MTRKPATKDRKTLALRERRKHDRDEYRAALKEFNSFHPDNQTRDRLKAAERLDAAEKRLRRWLW